jgi:hypothetical protein
LLLHVLLEDRERSATASDDAIGAGPEGGLAVHAAQLSGEVAADQPAAGCLHVVAVVHCDQDVDDAKREALLAGYGVPERKDWRIAVEL